MKALQERSCQGYIKTGSHHLRTRGSTEWMIIQALNVTHCQSTPSQRGAATLLVSTALLLQQQTLFIPGFLYIFKDQAKSMFFFDRNKSMLLGFHKCALVDLFLIKELKPK